MCSPRLLGSPHPLREPADLRWHTLLHVGWATDGEYWPDWRMWLLAAGVGDVAADEGEVLSIGGPGWCFVKLASTAAGRQPPNRPVPERDEKQSATSRPVCTKHDRFSIGSKRGIEVLTRVTYRLRERDARAALRRKCTPRATTIAR